MTPGGDNRLVPPLWFRVGARVRGVALPVGSLCILAAVVSGLALPDSRVPDLLTLAAAALLVLALALTAVPGGPRTAAHPMAAPVVGRWSALNSPASRVPSHGTHGHGQTFAIDLVYEPEDGARPRFGEGPAFRPPEQFPAFGQTVVAPVDGRVAPRRADRPLRQLRQLQRAAPAPSADGPPPAAAGGGLAVHLYDSGHR